MADYYLELRGRCSYNSLLYAYSHIYHYSGVSCVRQDEIEIFSHKLLKFSVNWVQRLIVMNLIAINASIECLSFALIHSHTHTYLCGLTSSFLVDNPGGGAWLANEMTCVCHSPGTNIGFSI